ncbi:MAG: SMP-30/gluconolactonase/LRE family protein [Acidobacteriota bacterium]
MLTSLYAQPPASLNLAAEAAKLQALVAATPHLSLSKTVLKVQPPSPGWEMGFPSAVASDASGVIYILQRGEKADPVLAVNRDGHILRSWGKGMYTIPHSIRVDPAGNVWIVDAASSKITKFTPLGKQLLEIVVGGQPAAKNGFNSTTDIAFGPDGRLFISDGYGNARVLEYTATGQRVREWGKAGNGPGELNLPHGIAIDAEGIVYVADRENGRVQRFSLDGRFLGLWDFHGKVFSIAAAKDSIWIGTQHFNEPNGAPGWFFELDRRTGKPKGYVETYQGQHVLNLTADGGLLAGARPDTVLWFRKAKH